MPVYWYCIIRTLYEAEAAVTNIVLQSDTSRLICARSVPQTATRGHHLLRLTSTLMILTWKSLSFIFTIIHPQLTEKDRQFSLVSFSSVMLFSCSGSGQWYFRRWVFINKHC